MLHRLTTASSRATRRDSAAGRPRMYKLLRNFSIAAFISFLAVIPIHTYVYYKKEALEHVRTGELKNIAASQVLRNSLSHVYAPLLSGDELDDEQLTVTIEALAEEVAATARRYRHRRARALQPRRRQGVLYCARRSDQTCITASTRKGNPSASQAALQGIASSRMLEGERKLTVRSRIRTFSKATCRFASVARILRSACSSSTSDVTREIAHLRDEVTESRIPRSVHHAASLRGLVS